MRILIVNDVGFLGGAGIATRRQVESLLMLGHDVMLLCHDPIHEHAAAFEPSGSPPGQWLGLASLPGTHRSSGIPVEVSSRRVAAAAARAYPDAIIVGNIHGAGWSAGLLLELRRLGAPVVAYLHDLHFITGRCTHPYECEKYLGGCDATCPTAGEYPPLAPELIHQEWGLRRQAFCEADAVHAACNSRWTEEKFRRSMPEARSVTLLHLGLDVNRYRPGDKVAARARLGIPRDRFVILAAAMKFSDPHKGGTVFGRVAEKLSGAAHFVALGGGAGDIPVHQAFPHTLDAGRITDLHMAADVFLATSTAESFGQTLLEAAACGRPVVALRVGGIPDIVRDGETGRLVNPGTLEAAADELVERLRDYQRSESLRAEHGENARRLVAAHFSLEAQAERWADLLRRIQAP